jgi:beta-glucosidase
LYVGYRHHDNRGVAPLFPFGFGLSYTSFQWGEPKASSADMGKDGISVELTLKNTGERAGSDLVQLYVRPLGTSVNRPDKELRAFAKVRLDPGQSADVHLSVTQRDLCYFDVDAKAFVAPAGDYELLISSNAAETHGAIRISLAGRYVQSITGKG